MSINCKNMTVSYGNFKALDDFSYEFCEGNIYCILGQNGCGKTTLLKNIVKENWRTKEISYVAQETIGMIGLTVFEYIALGKYNPDKFYNPLSESDVKEIDEAMETLEIKNLKERMFDTLSGGEKQRVMVARSLVQNSKWILLDEPGSNMDIRHNSLIMDTFLKLKEKGKSFIIVIHDINTASIYADKILFMKQGKLICSGTTEDVMNEENLKNIYDIKFMSVTSDNKKIFIPEIST